MALYDHQIPLDALPHVLVRFQDSVGTELEGFGILPEATWLAKRALIVAKGSTITYTTSPAVSTPVTYANGTAAIAKFSVIPLSQPEIAVILKAFDPKLTSAATFYSYGHFPLAAFAA